MAPTIEVVESSTTASELLAVLERDGAVVVAEALSADQLARLNGELDGMIRATAPGLRHPSHQAMVEFYGHATVRFDGLAGKSATFLEVMLLPLLCQTADHFLLPNCLDYILNTGQLIEIRPGETPQRLHRDEDAWGYLRPPKPQLEVEAMFALSDFTRENGATQVVVSSHLWPNERQAEREEIIQAEMRAGSALFYLGTTLHGGAANRTDAVRRRGMFLGYVVGWLRAEENSFLTVPIEQVRGMPARVQELLGYKAHRAIGVVDVGSPMALLR